MDSDVEVYKSFDEFLKYSFFTGTDVNDERDYFAIEPAIMGAEKGNMYLKECLDYYGKIQFTKADGSIDLQVMPYIVSPLLEKYGYKAVDETQYLSHNIVVFSSAYFATLLYTFSNTLYKYLLSALINTFSSGNLLIILKPLFSNLSSNSPVI